MKNIKKKEAIVKQMPNEDTSKYIDYSQPLNFKQLVKSNNADFKKKPRKSGLTFRFDNFLKVVKSAAIADIC